ncbi:TetR/AcrR family transcriptional regulator [Chitinophaga alhagiae]|uniref:TetR/AcrR family transcriptional regulator n=1 Tax=Chitinophaga alhagiae TaxID=2203219 RepID=UPI000E5C2A35|nr:TetR/AcrR family transcriptional regulator [Chitinophaga alhagiae]
MESASSKAERTRRYIIEKTAGVFNTKGFAGTSLSDITEATGLTKGSIYGNFESKEAVAVAVFDHNHAQVVKEVTRQMEKAAGYYEKLMVYAQTYSRFVRNNYPEGGCPILNTAVEADDTNGLLKQRAAAAVLGWKKNIELLIRGGVTAGEFKQGIDAAQLALSIIALIEGGIMIARVTDSPRHLHKVLKTVEWILNGIRL